MWAHNPEVGGSSPPPATKTFTAEIPVIARGLAVFLFIKFAAVCPVKTVKRHKKTYLGVALGVALFAISSAALVIVDWSAWV